MTAAAAARAVKDCCIIPHVLCLRGSGVLPEDFGKIRTPGC